MPCSITQREYISKNCNCDFCRKRHSIYHDYYVRHRQQVADKNRRYGQSPNYQNKKRIWNKKYYVTHRERLKEYVRRHGQTEAYRISHKKALAKFNSTEHGHQRWNQWRRIQNRRTRQRAIAAYGGKCVICGESRYSFLTFDHIEENGALLRRVDRKNHSGSRFYYWALQTAPNPSLQVLCYNCNAAKAYANHWRKRSSKPLLSNREHMRQWARAYMQQLRLDAISAYGGRCVCCGQSNPIFLTFDHVNNDGYVMRKRFKGMYSLRLLGWLRRNHYPPSIQLLCWNCNRAKLSYGLCPHSILVPFEVAPLVCAENPIPIPNDALTMRVT